MPLLGTTENELENTPFAGEAADEGFRTMVRKSLNAARTAVTDFREQAQECDRFYHGDQWDPEDIAVLKAQRRAPLTINKVAPYVNAVIGFELLNRQRCTFVPRNAESVATAAGSELATHAYQWVLDECYGDDERSQAFRDMLIRGMGWVETRYDAEDDEDGRIIRDRGDGSEMYWDQAARKQNLEDATWVARRRYIRLDDVRAMFGDEKADLIDSGESLDGDFIDLPEGEMRETTAAQRGPDLYLPNGDRYSPNMARDRDGFVLVTDFRYRERETVHQVRDPETGENVELTEKEYRTLKSRVPVSIPSVKKKRWVYKRGYLAGSVVLESPKPLPVQGGLGFEAMTYLWDSQKKVWYGITRCLLDPQRGSNKYLSQAMAIFSASPKGALLIEKGAVLNMEKLADAWASPTGIIPVRDGTVRDNKIQAVPSPTLSQASVQLAQIFNNGFKDASGVNIELLGMSEGNQPGVTMRQRQTQGIAILAVAFNALSRFRKREARVVLEWTRELLADGRLIRIGGEYDSQAIPLLREPLFAKYDIIIDENPHNPNTRSEAWEAMQSILPVFVREGLFVADFLDYAPLPASITAKVKKKYEELMQARQQGAGQEPPKAGKSPEEIAAEVALKQAQTQLTMVRARAIAEESGLDLESAKQQLRHREEFHGLEGHERLREQTRRDQDVRLKAGAALAKGVLGVRKQVADETARYQERLDDKGQD